MTELLEKLPYWEQLTEEERRAWYREGIESLREYRRTGLHITFEEYSAWVDRLDTDPDAPFPKCHV